MTVLDRVPVGDITARARAVEPSAVAMAWLRRAAVVVAALLFLVGWLPAKAIRALVFAGAWVGAAVAEGWSDGWTRERDG